MVVLLRFERASGTNVTFSKSGKDMIMDNACSILGEGVLVVYLLSPLSTIGANNHAQETYLPDIVWNIDG
jgi:hypothetical protein